MKRVSLLPHISEILFKGSTTPSFHHTTVLFSNLFSLGLFSFIGTLAHYKSVDQYSERSDLELAAGCVTSLKGDILNWISIINLYQLIINLKIDNSMIYTVAAQYHKIFSRGHRGGKMHFWGSKNPKNCQKLLILALFFFFLAGRGMCGGKSLRRGDKCPLDAATGYMIYSTSRTEFSIQMGLQSRNKWMKLLHLVFQPNRYWLT